MRIVSCSEDETDRLLRLQGTSIVAEIVSRIPEFGEHIAHDRKWFESNAYVALTEFFHFAERAAKESNVDLATRIYLVAEPYFAKPDGDADGDAMCIEMLEPIFTCVRPPSDHMTLLYTCLGPVGKAIVDRYSDAFGVPRSAV